LRKSFKTSRLRIVELIIVGLLTYILACTTGSKLFFLQKIINPEICNLVLDWLWLIFIILIMAYLIIYYLKGKRDKVHIARKIYNNICEEIFNRFIKEEEVDNHLFKVTIFKAFKESSRGPFLSAVGRFQIKESKKKCKVKFLSGEGCVGLSYRIGQSVEKTIDEYDGKNPEKYFDDSERIFKLKKNKAKKLNDYACSFLCIPIKYFGQDRPWGVVSIDCMKKFDFSSAKDRKIEDVLSCFSTFFVEE